MSASPDDRTVAVSPDLHTVGATALVLPEGVGAPGEGNTADSTTLPIGTRLFEFEITGLIGVGGFGIVYAAYDHSLHRQVAIKEYMPASLASRTRDYKVVVRSQRDAETFEVARRSFVNEARLLAQFDHPSLVKVFRFWEANGTAYMVMPLYKGQTLKQRLKAMGTPPTEAWLVNLLRQVMDALAVIHAENCFHRDVAPDNILLVEGDRPVLLDFGAARRVISDMTQSLTVILKPGYAPIEQYAEIPSMKQGAWTDVYALAAVAHFALTGAPPDPSVSRMMKDSVPPLAGSGRSGYSETFLRAIDAALRVRPEDRPQSVAAFWALIDNHMANKSPVRPAQESKPKKVEDVKVATPDKPMKAPAKLGWPIVAFLVVLFAGGTGAGLFLLQSRFDFLHLRAQTDEALPPAQTEQASTPEPSQEATQPPEPGVTPTPPVTEQSEVIPAPTEVAPEPPTTVQPPPPQSRTRVARVRESPRVERNTDEARTPATPASDKIQEYLQAGEQALQRGEWRRAQHFADNALALDAGNAAAHDIKRRAQQGEKKAAFEGIRIE